ncbi:MAG: PilZ domain-containing protein [Candidatus Methylomirabilales bacterium]
MKQRFPRYAIQVPVLFRRLDQEGPAQAGIGWTLDLSEGGACLELQVELPVGCLLGLVIFANPETVEAEARVVLVEGRLKETFVHGVEFLQLPPAQYDALLKALPQEKTLRQKTIRLPITLPAYCKPIRTNTPSLEGWTGDISRTGVMVFLPQVLSPNTEVEITLQTAQGQLRLPTQVRWADTSTDGVGPFRHGLEFLGGPLDPQRLLSLFVGTLAEENWLEQCLSPET